MHNHQYFNVTTFHVDHRHSMSGFTTEDPDVPGHTHRMFGYTSRENGHVHDYNSFTGPAIYDAGGGHYHQYGGTTGYADGHVHGYMGATSRYGRDYMG